MILAEREDVQPMIPPCADCGFRGQRPGYLLPSSRISEPDIDRGDLSACRESALDKQDTRDGREYGPLNVMSFHLTPTGRRA